MSDALERSPLYTREPTQRFSSRAADYARYRPTYPGEAIATMLEGLGEPATLQVADVGAGTGISARLLAERGVMVWAIEPNAAMRAAADPHPRVEFRDATAERTQLPDQSVDLVACCQAFHWFEPIATLTEFRRILKPGGRVALMWNDRDLKDPITARYTELVRAASDQSIFSRQDRKSPQALAQSSLFTNFRQYTFSWTRRLDLASLIGVVMSSSYVPQTGEAREQLTADLTTLYEQNAVQDGPETHLPLAHCTDLYLAEPISL